MDLPEPVRVHVGTDCFSAYRALMRARAHWLLDKGLAQWAFVLTPGGEELLAARARDHEVYLFHRDGVSLATICLQWQDTAVWGPDPDADGNTAGYAHGLATHLGPAARGVGAGVLDWSAQLVASRGRRKLRLDCWDANEALKAYYTRLDFTDAGLCFPYGPEYPTRRWEKDVGR